MLTGLNHITLAVSNLNSSLSFYTTILGFKGHVKWATGAYLSLGDLWLCLSLGKPAPKQDYSHIAFSIPPLQFHIFQQQLRTHNVVEWKSNSSEGDSIYLLDPDEHQLEIHAGDLHSRLNSRLNGLQLKPYKDLIWL